MKTGEIIGIAGGATVIGAIVWFIYRKQKVSRFPLNNIEDLPLKNKNN